MKLTTLIILSWAISVAATASATPGTLQIEIPCACSNKPLIAVASFAHEEQLPQKISDIIKSDLLRSGAFRVIDGTLLSDGNSVDYSAYARLGADALLAGSVERLSDGRVRVSYRLLDISRRAELSTLDMAVAPPTYRRPAHLIADDTYLKLTGVSGVSATRIAYVRYLSSDYQIMVADADGQNADMVVRSNEPIMAPAGSPDGDQLAYIAYQQDKPVVVLHQFHNGANTVLANHAHHTSAPAWSPDGKQLALSLSSEGRWQIYTIRADSHQLQRISTGTGNDTEPQWSADGLSIYFTSDRGGGLQIYRMAPNGDNSQRVTFSASQNTSAHIAPDNQTLVYLASANGSLQLTALDLNTRKQRPLAQAADAPSPSFAPNGQAILYTAGSGTERPLTVISTDGAFKQVLSVPVGDNRWPAWGGATP